MEAIQRTKIKISTYEKSSADSKIVKTFCYSLIWWYYNDGFWKQPLENL